MVSDFLPKNGGGLFSKKSYSWGANFLGEIYGGFLHGETNDQIMSKKGKVS